MNRRKSPFKNALILCLPVFFSVQTHGAGKVRKQFFRLLPFIAPKAYKQERLERKEKARIKKKVTSMDDLSLMVLESELKKNNYNIATIEEMAKASKEEVYRRINKDKQFNTPIKILQEALDRGTNADMFFSLFNLVAIPSPEFRYRNSLGDFFEHNAEAIGELSLSPEQIERIGRYINFSSSLITFLKESLKRAEGDADKFFAIFKAVTWALPPNNDLYRSSLSDFFEHNAETIGELPFSAEQIEYIDHYIKRVETTIVLLEGGLMRAERNPDQFFAILNKLTETARKEIHRRINKDKLFNTPIKILQKALDRKTSADVFFSLFNFVAIPSPGPSYRMDLGNLFEHNAEAIGKLSLSPEQIEHIDRYIAQWPSTITFLEEGLKRAKGDADKFFAIFKAISWSSPSSNRLYKSALINLFEKNADAIDELSLSPEQIEHIGRYIDSIPISITFLKKGLKRAEGDADKFFATFKAVTWNPSPSEKYQDVLNKFFTDNAKNIGELSFSSEQVGYIGHTIKRVETIITLLEGGLMRAQRNPDQFFATFNAIATIPPNNKYRDALKIFFTDNAENIGELSFSAKQVKRLGRYFRTSSPSSLLLGMLENLKKNQKKRRRSKREVCIAGAAALLSLSILPENNE